MNELQYHNLFDKFDQDQQKSNYVITDYEQLQQLRYAAEEKSKVGMNVGVINMGAIPAIRDEMITDKEGNKLNIRDLHLLMVGSISDPPPPMDVNAMKSFSEAVARAGTYNQRNLPIWKKFAILWHVFAELFLNVPPKRATDPYIQAAYEWRDSQMPKKTKKERFNLFVSRVKDLFVFRVDAENLETFGMPGFNPFRTAVIKK